VPTLPPGIGGSSTLSLNESQVAFLRRLQAAIPHIPLYVTSATRTPESQASALATKRNLGDDLYKLYSKANHDIIRELMAVPNTVADMARVIQKYVDQGRFLSRHMRGDAIDLRSKNLTSAQIQEVINAAIRLGAKGIYETKPPHIHVESIGHLVAQAKQAARDTAAQVQTTVRDTTARVQQVAQETGRQAQEAAERQRRRAERAAEALYVRRQALYTVGSASIALLIVGLFAYRKYRKTRGKT